MKKNSLIVAALLFAIYLGFPAISLAQSGSLDLTFDTDGIVTTSVGTVGDNGNAVAIQSDGKIVVVGSSFVGSYRDFAVVRYNADGSLDNTFDSDGIVVTSIGVGNDEAYSIAIQSDGKIVVAGSGYNGGFSDFAVVRYNVNGSLDNTFDGDGIVLTPIGLFDDNVRSVAIQSDGKIVAAGFSSNGTDDDFALIRYNTNGSLDNTFDTDGIVTTPIGVSNDFIVSLGIQTDGKIVVAGASNNGSNFDFAVLRYNVNGSLDNTFDGDGIVLTPIGLLDDMAQSVAIQSDGKIVAAGYTSISPTDADFALVRYNTNGSLDNTFDTDGIVSTPIGTSYDFASSIAIQADGKIVTAGSTNNGSDYDFSLVRYNANGSLDNTFDSDGIVTTAVGAGNDLASCLVIQSDDKILVAGKSFNGSTDIFALVRYNNNVVSGINTISNQNTEIDIYPNPFSIQTILKTENILIDAILIVYNSYGDAVREIKNINRQTINISRDNLSCGLYFVKLIQDNKIIAIDKLLIVD